MNLIDATVLKSTGKWYDLLLKDNTMVTSRLHGKSRLTKTEFTNPIAVGDYVGVEFTKDKDYVIREIKPRENYILRKSTKLSSRFQIIAANIDQAFIVVTLKSPVTSTHMIDSFLATCEAYHIRANIIFNKVDLLESSQEKEKLQKFIACYTMVGYKCFQTSFLNQKKCDYSKLVNQLSHKKSLVFGASGVGKSTWINLVTETKQETQEISKQHSQGRHTTTFASMLSLKERNGFIIDTPGVREFSLAGFSPHELGRQFPEINLKSGECKYRNCLHLKEKSCEVKDSLRNHPLLAMRYQSYVSLLSELSPD